jgi:regulator of sirC expression with transglutaminase-like and TPR domain
MSSENREDVRVALSFAGSPEFQLLLKGDPAADLTRIALEIARDHDPNVDVESALAQIEALAARVRDRCPSGSPIRTVLGQINWVLFTEEGYRGNAEDYYDPRNSFLNEVLARRTGIPITLAILYRDIGERVGVRLDGVNLPAHFVLRTGPDDEELFIDAFHEGALLDRAACVRLVDCATGRSVVLEEEQFRSCTLSTIVARVLQNLKAIYVRASDPVGLLPVVRRLAALAPDDPERLRDYGVVCLRAEKLGEAIGPLEAYLETSPGAPDAGEVRALLRGARHQVASWN